MATNRTVKTTLIAQVDGYLDGMNKAAKKTKELGSEAEKLAQKKEAFAELGQAGLAVGALAAAGVTLAVSKFADFDQAMSNVKAATQETASNMDLLREAALDAGGETVFSAVEAAQAIEELGKAGLTTADILDGGLKGALDLAAAGQIDVARAAEVTAITLQQFKLGGERATDVADLLAAGAGKAAGGVEDLAQALGQSALVAEQTGLTVEETTGVLSAFASAGLLGSDAGTSLKTALQRLTPQSKEAKTEMERLGISAFDAQGKFIGAAALAGELEEGLSGLTDEQRNASTAIIFGSDAVRAASILYQEGADGIQEWIDKTDDSGFAARVAADRLDNLKGDVEKLGGAFETALIESGGSANDMLRQIVQSTTFLIDGVSELPTPVLEGATAIGTMTAAVGLTGGAAFLAVPKVAQFRTALSTAGITAKSASVAIGGVGAALGLASIAVGAFISKQAEADGRTDAFTDSLDTASGALTDYTRDLVIKRLEEAGAFKDAEGYGITQRELTDAVLEGGAAYDVVQGKLSAVTEGLTGQQKRAAGLKAEYSTTNRVLRETSDELENAREAFDNASAATDGNEESMQAFEASTAAAEAAVADLSEMLSAFGGAQLDARAAQRALESAVDDATAAVEANGATLDINTEKGRDNQAALDEIATSANEAASAIYDQTGSIDDASAALARGREQYILTGVRMGLTQEQAEDYADALIATPEAVTTQVNLVGVEAARARLQGLASAYLNGGSVSLRAVVQGDSVGNANGGIYAYANGGISEGIYSGGTPLYKFAEPETRWEAFISGKPGQEGRNREIWADAGARLGMSVAPAAPGPIYVQNPFTGAYLLAQVDGRAQQAVQTNERAQGQRLSAGWVD